MDDDSTEKRVNIQGCEVDRKVEDRIPGFIIS